jgi:hypothetical protein
MNLKRKQRYEARRDGFYPREYRVWDTRRRALMHSTNSPEQATALARALNEADPPLLRERLLRQLVRAIELLKSLKPAPRPSGGTEGDY